MRLNELLTESIDNWYHGSPHKFNKFDINAERINRASNPVGIYLTKNIKLAQRYAGENGYVYKVEPHVHNTFIDKVTKVNEKLAQSYREALYKHTTYQYKWIDEALIPAMYENNRIKSDIDGIVKTETYVNAGYDSFLFMDMFDESLVIFDTNDVSIIGIV